MDLSRPAVDALVYTVISTFVGPIIYLFGYTYFHSSDHCQPRMSVPDYPIGHMEQIDTAAQPDSRGAASRAYENYFDAQIFWVTGAGVMLAVGIFLLVNLLSTTQSVPDPAFWSVTDRAAVSRRDLHR
ncbi:hypothetical protein ACQP1G_15880 [Nocardia sp. CA-107356]|uniref:hypothetical protein n=1 Tax=Nocardia sp. CA-107356 TaxID=3239972 RepID=UPI003D923679